MAGRIVNISSLAAWEAYPFVGYKTMKAALLALRPPRPRRIAVARATTLTGVEPPDLAGVQRTRI